ncbi:MAG: hypothetical protein PHX04_05235 [Bacilli bacterium]|nr:hypothetical protein [Bacilli bacterium]
MNTKRIIFVGGAASVGKTSLINNLKQRGTVTAVEKSDIYKDLGKKRNISSIEELFSKITEEDYVNYITEIFSTTDTLILGLHYAFQPQKDTLLFLGINQGEESESYKCSISDNLIEMFNERGISLVSAILTANPDTLLNRAINRNKLTGQPIRNFILEDTIRELEAEHQFFEEISLRSQANFVVKVDEKSLDVVCNEFLSEVRTLITSNDKNILGEEQPSNFGL